MSQPRRIDRRRGAVLIASLLVLVGAAAVGLVLGRVIGEREPIRAAGPAYSSEVVRKLDEAQRRAPYELLIPSWVPPGVELRVVEWLDDPGARLGPVLSVDMVYEGSPGLYLHIWISNIPPEELIAAGKDPVTSYDGEPWLVAGGEWRAGTVELIDASLQTLSGRGDGITISIDGTFPTVDLQRVAESLAPLDEVR